MPFSQMMSELFTNAMHSSAPAFIGVPLIFIYFSWIVYRAVKQIRTFLAEDLVHH